MFTLNDDKSIYATRGDIVFFSVSAEENGVQYKFKAGDVVRIKVYGKKDAEAVVLQKDFPVTEETEEVEIFLSEEDTKIGNVISKPTDYWYEVELNPYNNPQTIIGYDEDGAKVFKLFPEGADIPAFEPTPEDIPFIDDELDLVSTRPVQNQAIARAVVRLRTAFDKTDAESKDTANALAVERERIDNLVSGATADGAEVVDIRVGADGITYASAGTAVRKQFSDMSDNIVDEIALLNEKKLEIVPTLYDGFAKYATGIVSDDSFDGYYKRTGYIYIPSLCKKIFHNFIANDTGVDGIVFYDAAKQYITGYKSNGTITNIPDGARYVVFSNYDNLRTHSGKTFTMLAETEEAKSGIKTLVTFGDSHVARGLWQQKVIEQFGVEKHINLGIGGSTVAVNEEATVLPFVDDARITAIEDANPDMIIIIGGTNDVHLHTPLGSMSDIAKKDKTTFYGAYGYLIETLLEWKHSLQIILCTTPHGFYDNIHPVKYSEVSEAVREIAKHYSLPVADIFGKCGINKVNLATYSDDLIHYNELGNERVSALIANTIKGGYFD